VCPRAVLDTAVKRKIPSPCRESSPARSPTLYRLSYRKLFLVGFIRQKLSLLTRWWGSVKFSTYMLMKSVSQQLAVWQVATNTSVHKLIKLNNYHNSSGDEDRKVSQNYCTCSTDKFVTDVLTYCDAEWLAAFNYVSSKARGIHSRSYILLCTPPIKIPFLSLIN
jgi:hypothetical protein